MADVKLDPDNRRIMIEQQIDDLIKGLKLSASATAALDYRNKVRPSANLDASYPMTMGGGTVTPYASVGTNSPPSIGIRGNWNF